MVSSNSSRAETSDCGECLRKVGNSARGLQCDSCNRWVHIKCDKRMPVEVYNVLTKYTEVPLAYGCPKCEGKSRNILKDFASIGSQTDKTPKCSKYSQTGSQFDKAPKCSKHSQTGVKMQSAKIQTDNITNPQAVHRKPVASTSRCISSNLYPEQHKPDTLNRKTQKPTPTPLVTQSRAQTSNDVILFNVPESTSTSLAVRDSEDHASWIKVCEALNEQHHLPKRLVRLRWNREGPRPLRVELKPETNSEKIIIWSNHVNSAIKVRPDLPWEEREARRQEKAADPTANILRARSIVLHGIPESNENPTHPLSHLDHDIDQWNFIRGRLGVVCRAQRITRLPRPLHLNGITSPRLLRVTLETIGQTKEILAAWESLKPTLPGHLRIHPDLPRTDRVALKRTALIQQPAIILNLPSVSKDSETGISKNFNGPTHMSA